LGGWSGSVWTKVGVAQRRLWPVEVVGLDGGKVRPGETIRAVGRLSGFGWD